MCESYDALSPEHRWRETLIETRLPTGRSLTEGELNSDSRITDHVCKVSVRPDIRLYLVPDHGPLLESISHANQFRFCESIPEKTDPKPKLKSYQNGFKASESI